MSPEQSKASGPVAPHTYGVPSLDSAASIADAARDDGWSAAGFAAGFGAAAAAWRGEAATVLYCGATAGAMAATTGMTPVVTAGAWAWWEALCSERLLDARFAGSATSPVEAGSSPGSRPCAAGPPAPARGPSGASARRAGRRG